MWSLQVRHLPLCHWNLSDSISQIQGIKGYPFHESMTASPARPVISHMIICKHCNMTYIGETGLWLEDQFCQHLSDINKAHKPNPQHSNHRDHEGKRDISVTAICSCSSGECACNSLEQCLISHDSCLHPAGLNSQFSYVWRTLSLVQLHLAHISFSFMSHILFHFLTLSHPFCEIATVITAVALLPSYIFLLL